MKWGIGSPWIRRPHPKYGYDLDKVPEKLCLICEKPIGGEEYTEITQCARFGQMLFAHRRCMVKYTWRPEKCVPLVVLGYILLGGLATGPVWLWLLG